MAARVEWLQNAVSAEPEAFIFASEAGTPLRADNLMKRIIRPVLQKVGLGWFNFQVARRTHASLGHDTGIDPKVAADQRGHSIGVSLDVYTRSSAEQRAEAAAKLERKILQMPNRKSA